MASSMAVRTSDATLWGWRINKNGTPAELFKACKVFFDKHLKSKLETCRTKRESRLRFNKLVGEVPGCLEVPYIRWVMGKSWKEDSV